MRSITLRILADGTSAASRTIGDIPWYPGITILDALMIADGMFEDTFTFQIKYTSVFGAWMEEVDGVANASPKYWFFHVNDVPIEVGPSSLVLPAPTPGEPVRLDLVYQEYTHAEHPSI